MDTHILAMIFKANIFVPTLNYKEAYMFVNIRHKYPLSVKKKKKKFKIYIKQQATGQSPDLIK